MLHASRLLLLLPLACSNGVGVLTTRSTPPTPPPALTVKQVVVAGTVIASAETSGSTVAVTTGGLAGTVVNVPPGTLAVGSSVQVLETAVPEAFTASGASALSLPAAVAALAADGSALTTLPNALTVTLTVDGDASALRLAAPIDALSDNVCVLLEDTQKAHFVWRRSLLKIDALGKTASFQTTRVGAFQLATCDSDLKGNFVDASAAGVSGSFATAAVMTVHPGDHPLLASGAAATFCMQLVGPTGETIEQAQVPAPATNFTVHLVVDGAMLKADEAYSLKVALAAGTCGPSDGSEPLARFASFPVKGAEILAHDGPRGLLGDANGPFPLVPMTLKIANGAPAGGAASPVQPACLAVWSTDAADKEAPLLTQQLEIQGAKINGSDEPLLFWHGVAASASYDAFLVSGEGCAAIRAGGAPSPGALRFHAVSPEGTLHALHALLEVRLWADLASGMPARPGTATLPACVDAFPDTAADGSPLASFPIAANAPDRVVAEEDFDVVPIAILLPDSPTTPGRLRLRVYEGLACDKARSGTPRVFTVTSGRTTYLDLEAGE